MDTVRVSPAAHPPPHTPPAGNPPSSRGAASLVQGSMCAPSRAPGAAWMAHSRCTFPTARAALEREAGAADAAVGTASPDVLRRLEPDRSASGHIGAPITALQLRHLLTVPPRAGDNFRVRGTRAPDPRSVLNGCCVWTPMLASNPRTRRSI